MVVITEGKHIKYIYHSADIHIRVLERHQEYLKVFENLKKILEGQDDLESSVFVVCGDIFHNRDRLTPETISIFNEFIKYITSVMDLIMITGNHDAFNHTHRMDTISGIVNVADYPRLYYLRDTGVYHYHNIAFGVWSVIDGGTPCEILDTNYIKVALFHGPVSGCKLQNGMSYHEGVEINRFKGYDYVLLGDIHKRQYLNKFCAYPGSLIQQNFKEDICCGILKWDIIQKTSQFIRIPNDYGFITIIVDKSGEITYPDNYPKFCRVKIKHHLESPLDVSSIKKYLSKFTTIMSISKEMISQQREYKNQRDISVLKTETDYFNELLKEVPKNLREDISILHMEMCKEFNKDLIECKPWSIKSISFNGVFIFRDTSINKLEFKDGITGILGNNAIGKSSLFNLVLYSLFGTITKNKNILNRNVINRESKTFSIIAEIVSGEDLYEIVRKGKNKKRKGQNKTMEETLRFYMTNSKGIKKELTGSNKVSTQEAIKNTLGLVDKEIFTLTNVLSYTHYKSLLNASGSELNDIFSRLFNLEFYQDIYTKVTKKYKETEIFLKNTSTTIENIEKELDDCHTDLSGLPLLKTVDSKITEIQEEIKGITFVRTNTTEIDPSPYISKINLLKGTSLNIHEVKHLRDACFDKLSKENGLIVATNSNMEYLQSILGNAKSQIKEIIPPCSRKEYECAQRYLDNFFKNHFLPDFDLNLKFSDGHYLLPENTYNSIKQFINKMRTDKFLNIYSETKTLVDSYECFLQDKQKNIELHNYIRDLEGQINYLLHKDIREYDEDIEYLLLKKKIEDINENIINRDNNILHEKLTKNLTELISNRLKIKHLQERIFSLKNKKNELNTLREQSIIEENKLRIYKQLVKTLPIHIMGDVLKNIKLDATELIYNLTGLTLELNLEEDSKHPEISFTKDNSTSLGPEQISGYEKFVTDISLKMALYKYKYSSSIDTFYIDEMFDCISDENFDKIDYIFEKLLTVYNKLLVISHNEELKKKVNNRITLENFGSYSLVK